MSLITELRIDVPEAGEKSGGRPDRILAYLVALTIECRQQGFAAMALPEDFGYVLRDYPKCEQLVAEIRRQCSASLILEAAALKEIAAGRKPGHWTE
jgi:hypothetical protein